MKTIVERVLILSIGCVGGLLIASTQEASARGEPALVASPAPAGERVDLATGSTDLDEGGQAGHQPEVREAVDSADRGERFGVDENGEALPAEDSPEFRTFIGETRIRIDELREMRISALADYLSDLLKLDSSRKEALLNMLASAAPAPPLRSSNDVLNAYASLASTDPSGTPLVDPIAIEGVLRAFGASEHVIDSHVAAQAQRRIALWSKRAALEVQSVIPLTEAQEDSFRSSLQGFVAEAGFLTGVHDGAERFEALMDRIDKSAALSPSQARLLRRVWSVNGYIGSK